MFKLSKVGIAAVLGLTLVFSAFSSGAFAQSINQNSIREVVQTTVNQGQAGQNWTAKHYPMSNQQGNRWHNGCGWHMNCHKPVVHKRCVRVVRWIKFGHTTRRVVSWVCRR